MAGSTDCERVYEALRVFLGTNPHVLTNVYIFNWESDVFALSKSGIATEIEVKVSRSDYLADFKKQKHEFMKRPEEATIRMPNRFYFACPEGMVFADEVPAYAGLIYTTQGNWYKVIKKAPIIHRTRYDFDKDLLSKYYWNSVNTRTKMKALLSDIGRKPTCVADIEKKLRSMLRQMK